MFFFHGFYNHSLELRRISFVWYSFWHSKTPHLLDSISYCLTNGVQFRVGRKWGSLYNAIREIVLGVDCKMKLDTQGVFFQLPM